MRGTSTALFAIVAVIVVAGALHAAPPETVYIQARVEFESMQEMEQFMSLSHFDVMTAKPGRGVTIVTHPEELERIRGLGYNVTVELEDMEAEYASRVRGRDYGDFHDYDEILQYLDDLHANHPAITTEKFSIGTTYEGRDIWAIKISDNPDVDEPEPEVLYDGVHHAREIIVPEVLMHYMSWLCENYGTDSEATFLVDEREIWFIIVLNPDGFIYNMVQNPNGGGMWRQNRQPHPGGCRGTDLNRNYSYMWGTSGVSHDPCDDETYCGPNAFSELETQAYKAFAESREFVTGISTHSVDGSVLIPWSHSSSVHTPDDALFREIAEAMTQYNGYVYGQCGEVLWYSCSGTTGDWAYEDQGVYSFCIEVGGSGFWPQQSEIPGLRAENLWSQQYVTRIAGMYLGVVENVLDDGPMGNGQPDAGETLDFVVTVQNQGLSGSASDVAITLECDDPYVQLHDASSSLGAIGARDSADNSGDPFSFTVDPATPDAHGLVLKVNIEADGFSTQEEFSWMVGTPVTLFYDDMEGGTDNWIENDGYWGTTIFRSHSPTHSYTDSPGGSHQSYMNTWIELADPLDLSHASSAVLQFWHRVLTEADYDYCYTEVSDDGGASWHQVGPRYSGDNGEWEMVELDVGAYAGTSGFKVRFRFTSDTYINEDGWYVDDVAILGPPTGNARPSAPTLLDPPNGGAVTSSTPDLTVTNAIDPDGGDVLTYGFTVYADELCTDVAASVVGVAEGDGTTTWTVGSSLADGTYWWRSYADDGSLRGPLMDTGSFDVVGTGVDGELGRVALYPGRPNPFATESTLSFQLPVRSDVRFAVYGVDGRLVRTLVDGEAGPGTVAVSWDGRDERGRRVGSGLYFMKLIAGDQVRHGKIVVLK